MHFLVFGCAPDRNSFQYVDRMYMVSSDLLGVEMLDVVVICVGLGPYWAQLV